MGLSTRVRFVAVVCLAVLLLRAITASPMFAGFDAQAPTVAIIAALAPEPPPSAEPKARSTSVARRLRTLLVCSMLQFAALTGMPMRPEEIEELMQAMNQPKLARTTPDESERGDAPRT